MSESWETFFYGLLPNHKRTAFWVTMPNTIPELPYFSRPGEEIWHPVATVEEEISNQLGIPVRVLYRALYHQDDHTRRVTRLYVLEPRRPDDEPHTTGQWVEKVPATAIAPLQEAVQDCLEEWSTGEVPGNRPPWSRPGWYDLMWAWVERSLYGNNLAVTGRPIIVRNWALSYVLRVPTHQGSVYMKAGAFQPLFANEGQILQYLGTLFPNHVPVPLAIDAVRQWMLLSDSGPAMGWEAPHEYQQEMLTAYAGMQKDCAGRADELFAHGCIDRRLDQLATQVDYLTTHPDVQAALAEEELVRLQQLAPRLQADCQRLATYGVPETLGHGDLHGDNVARPKAGHYIFFDWTDACVMHPFIDMINIHFHKDENERAQLVDHYLEQWRDYDTPGRIRAAWRLAQPLMSLHQAVSYQMIIDHTEPNATSDLDWGPPYWLRQVIRAYAQIEDRLA